MEDEQAKKNFLMKVGIASFMVLILIFWGLNIKNVFRSNAVENDAKQNTEWQNIKKDFDETIDKMSVSLDKIEETNNKLKTASSSIINELILETNKLIASTTTATTSASSSPVSTSTSLSAPSEKIKSDCPAYINCMPTIGAARPCQIPVGCEEITQIAY